MSPVSIAVCALTAVMAYISGQLAQMLTVTVEIKAAVQAAELRQSIWFDSQWHGEAFQATVSRRMEGRSRSPMAPASVWSVFASSMPTLHPMDRAVARSSAEPQHSRQPCAETQRKFESLLQDLWPVTQNVDLIHRFPVDSTGHFNEAEIQQLASVDRVLSQLVSALS